MKILPVLDLMAGKVVHGKAGRRETYRPIVSRLCAGADPCDIARAFRDHFRFTELYVADLDAIAGAEPAFELYTSLVADGFQLWVDAGVHSSERAESLRTVGRFSRPVRDDRAVLTDGPGDPSYGDTARPISVVVGLETLPDLRALVALLKSLTPQHLVFSLDLKQGKPIASDGWGGANAFEIAALAVATGVTRLIVLDLAAVGMGGGPSTLELCTQLRCQYPRLELTTGGGVRGPNDLHLLRSVPVDFVLVASALHDGALGADK